MMSKVYILIIVVNLIVGLSSNAINKQKLDKINDIKENLESSASIESSDFDPLLKLLSKSLANLRAGNMEKQIENIRHEMEVQYLVSFIYF